MLTAVYDVRQDASEGLEGVPAVAPTAAEVARQCDVVLIAVVNAQQTIDVLNGPDGVLSQARPDLTLVLLANVPLQALKQLRELTDAAGVARVYCGVTGGRTVCQNGIVGLVGDHEGALFRRQPAVAGLGE